MKIESIPSEILADLRERGLSDAEIACASPKDAFSEWCNWHGLSGWGGTIWRVVEKMKEAGE